MELEKKNEKHPHIQQALLSILPESLGKTSEIEIRLGTIIDKYTGSRLSIETPHPCLIKKAETLRFEAFIEQKDYDTLNKHFQNEFQKKEKKIILDTLLKGCRRSEITHVNGERSKEPPILITKKKMATVDIFCPSSTYDLRIGISEEIIREDTGSMPISFGTREKRRDTFFGEGYVIDASHVFSSIKSSSQKQETYEVEVEADNQKYSQEGFTNILLNLLCVLEKHVPE
ncbi:hypothetical protein NEFER03_0837 [Nematocida sp. LUAm3]|nr:hypothetical protein NEFER03_0837 [Nematocida sp. LUAm3]KAI5174855.1 hypothetical protein NEFER02_0955 [Nematocida sp. LUAm2]KAI5177547.1 hypothetical protein NEFER01_0797 [Nematocida sp. LUAm1]